MSNERSTCDEFQVQTTESGMPCCGSGHHEDHTLSLTRRMMLGGLTAAGLGSALLAGSATRAQAAPRSASAGRAPTSLHLLGTAGGPAPLAERMGISSALVVNGKTYVVDCGRGAVTQYLRAGLSLASLNGIFITHLHADHVVDYFAFPMLAGGLSGAQGFHQPVDVYGPGPSGSASKLVGASPADMMPGIARLTELADQAYAAGTSFFLTEHVNSDPATMVKVHEVMPPPSSGASAANRAPAMDPFTVMENDDMKVSAILVPHGAVYPAYAYRFDTDHGSVVFSGDTGPTPNIKKLATGADVLVHEATYPAGLEQLGLSSVLIEHILQTHTDVALLGEIAASCGVSTLVATHLSPGDASVATDADWRKLLRRSARTAGYDGRMVAATDLMSLPVR